jgi:hypothetical protein
VSSYQCLDPLWSFAAGHQSLSLNSPQNKKRAKEDKLPLTACQEYIEKGDY